MGANFAVTNKPEEEELARKREELLHLHLELSERELALTSLRLELASFEGRYLRTVGVLYAELDAINAEIATQVAQQVDKEEARQDAASARQQAEDSYSAAHGKASEISEFIPTPDLKRLYREVAKRIHPDLASDPNDRAKRERLMSDANQAYERGDADALKQILEDYESSPEAYPGDGAGAELVRVIRKIKQGKSRLTRIEAEFRQLIASEISQLKIKTKEAEQQGRDLLAEMASNVQRQIELGKGRLETLRGKRERKV